jgi:CRISPR-associated exonuclease Cas4
MYDEDDLLPVSALQHLVFCERRCALIYLEGVWDENVATVEGRNLHDRTHDAGTEVRGSLRIARDLMLRSLRLGLAGKADVVEFHLLDAGEPEASGVILPGASGRWQPFPVEYKRGRLRHERSYEVQVCAQALCLEEMLGAVLPSGALFYGKSARREDVAFSPELRAETEAAAQRLHALFTRGKTPTADYYKRKCRECSLVDVCLPQAGGPRRSARNYLARTMSDSQPP